MAHSDATTLRHGTDRQPGIRRVGAGGQFRYLNVDGRPVRDAEVLARIRQLAIPPAYREVWISPSADTHLQATGVDARGRKQYRYHPAWRAQRDATKYHRLLDFAAVLPRLRARVRRDLKRKSIDRQRVLAAVVALLERTLIRVGNEAYARSNHHFGLTTLRGHHVQVSGSRLRFHFTGKSGVDRRVELGDVRLARLVRQLRELPGKELFHYLDERGGSHPLHSHDVNAYLQEASGGEFTAKDFRTWAGTVTCAVKLAAAQASRGRAATGKQARREVVAAIAEVAASLGNTPAVCRKAYIHPLVIEHHLAGALELVFGPADGASGLRAEERAVVKFLAAAQRQQRRAQTAAKERRRRAVGLPDAWR